MAQFCLLILNIWKFTIAIRHNESVASVVGAYFVKSFISFLINSHILEDCNFQNQIWTFM